MSKKSIKIKIGEKVYPLTVSEDEEKTVEQSAQRIAENIKKLKSQYKINDSLDLLAMTCLEFASKLQSNTKEETEVQDNTKELDSILNKLNQAISKS